MNRKWNVNVRSSPTFGVVSPPSVRIWLFINFICQAHVQFFSLSLCLFRFFVFFSMRTWKNKKKNSLIVCRIKLEVNVRLERKKKTKEFWNFEHSRQHLLYHTTTGYTILYVGSQYSRYALQLQPIKKGEHDWTTIWCEMNNLKPNSRSQIIIIIIWPSADR